MAETANVKEWDGLPVPRRHWAIAAIWLGITMAVLDNAIVNVALPAIARDLQATPAEAVWVVNAYQLAIVVALLPLSALGEIVGYRRVSQAGLFLFVVSAFACTQVETLESLVAMRSLQGLGAAGIMSINAALIRYTFPSKSLGRAIGYNAMIIATGTAAGPSVAAAILALGPWQWLFAIHLPFGFLSLVIGWAALPESQKSGRTLDVVSALLNVATFALIVTGVDVLTRDGNVWVGVGELVLGSLAAAFLVRRALSQTRPLVPVDLLRIRVFRLSVLTSIGSFSAQTLAYISLPFLLQNILHRDQVETGLLITPWPVAVGLAAPFAGHLADRFSTAILGGIGLATLSAGLLLLAFMPADPSTVDICWRMLVCGFGFGFFQSPNGRALMTSAPLDRSGAAAGMLSTSRLTGQTIGASVAAMVFHVSASAETTCLVFAAVFAGLAAVASLCRFEAKRG